MTKTKKPTYSDLLRKTTVEVDSAEYIVWTYYDYEGWHPDGVMNIKDAKALVSVRKVPEDNIIITKGVVK